MLALHLPPVAEVPRHSWIAAAASSNGEEGSDARRKEATEK
jgi:hypothetical protein